MNLGRRAAAASQLDWAPRAATNNTSNLTFRVTATSGSTTLTSTALMRDKVGGGQHLGQRADARTRPRAAPLPYTTVRAQLIFPTKDNT